MDRSGTAAGNGSSDGRPGALAHAALWLAAQIRGVYEPEAFRKGVIAGLLSALPYILFLLLQEPVLAVFGSLAAIRMGMSDPGRGQAFRHRARVLVAGALCVTAGTFFGTVLADGPLWTLPLVALLVLSAAYLGALGPDGLATSLTVLLPTVVCLGLPGDPLPRSAAVLGSCLFVALILLSAWPVDPDRPARQATAGAMRAVARLARLVAAAGPDDDRTQLWAARVAAYRAIDQALAIIAESLPRRRDGVPAPALLQLAAAASEARRMTRALTSISEIPATGGPQDTENVAMLAAGAAALEALDDKLRALPRPRGGRNRTIDLGLTGPTPKQGLGDASRVDSMAADGPAGSFRHSLQVTGRILAAGGAPPAEALDAFLMPQPGRTGRLFRWALPLLRDNLSLESSALRHAMRQAVLVAIATGLVWHFQIPHGYWAMLSIVFVTKPAFAGTRKAVASRMLATIIGVAAAELVLLGTHDFWVLALLALLFNCLSHGVVTVNYLVGYAMLTAYVIFKIEAALPDSDLTGPRLLSTLLGCGLAAASLAVWPPVSYDSFRRGIRRCLAAQAQVAASLAQRVAAGKPPHLVTDPALLQVRRQGRLGLQNAEAVLEEVFGDPAGRHPQRFRMRAVVQDLHRLTSLLAALSEPGRDLRCHAGALSSAAGRLDRLLAGTDDVATPAGLLDAPDELLRRYGAAIRDLSGDMAALASPAGLSARGWRPGAAFRGRSG